MNFEQGVQNNFIVTEMHGQQTRKMAVSTSDGCEDDMILGASASPTAGGDYTHTSTSRPSIVDSSGDYYTSAIIKNESGNLYNLCFFLLFDVFIDILCGEWFNISCGILIFSEELLIISTFHNYKSVYF